MEVENTVAFVVIFAVTVVMTSAVMVVMTFRGLV
jgi:hypothetical protein